MFVFFGLCHDKLTPHVCSLSLFENNILAFSARAVNRLDSAREVFVASLYNQYVNVDSAFWNSFMPYSHIA